MSVGKKKLLWGRIFSQIFEKISFIWNIRTPLKDFHGPAPWGGASLLKRGMPPPPLNQACYAPGFYEEACSDHYDLVLLLINTFSIYGKNFLEVYVY